MGGRTARPEKIASCSQGSLIQIGFILRAPVCASDELEKSSMRSVEGAA